MSKNLFLASAAKAAFALAAVAMMGTMFTSCSKDDDDNEKKFTNTVTIDGTNKSIVKAEYEDYGNGYSLYLDLSADHKEKVKFQLNKDLHMTGNPNKLTEQEKKHDGKWYWMVSYDKSGGGSLIYTFGQPGSEISLFTTGTLTVSGSPTGTINIKLENGLVKGKDGKDHTFTVSYSGTMMEK